MLSERQVGKKACFASVCAFDPFFIGGFVTTSTTKRADLDLDKYMVT